MSQEYLISFLSRAMKRAFERLKLDNSKKLKEQSSPSISFPTELGHLSPTGVGGDHPAWDIVVKKLDFQSQMKLWQQSQHLADVVETHAESELWKFQCQIRDHKYM